MSTDIVVREEMLLFPLDSLVSELGGALGLFLGFSFFGLLSSLQTAAKGFCEMMNVEDRTKEASEGQAAAV